MRVLPWFLGATVVVAIGGAVAGGAIDTTPRQIHESTKMPGTSPIAFGDTDASRIGPADHYALKAEGKTYEVAELRERGLYSQDRYALHYPTSEDGSQVGDFDFAAAEAEALRWEAEQRRAVAQRRSDARAQRRAGRDAPRRPLDLDRPAKVAQAGTQIEFVSQPVVQDTGTVARR